MESDVTEAERGHNGNRPVHPGNKGKFAPLKMEHQIAKHDRIDQNQQQQKKGVKHQ